MWAPDGGRADNKDTNGAMLGYVSKLSKVESKLLTPMTNFPYEDRGQFSTTQLQIFLAHNPHY